jgi:hypothetical protein
VPANQNVWLEFPYVSLWNEIISVRLKATGAAFFRINARFKSDATGPVILLVDHIQKPTITCANVNNRFEFPISAT